MSNMKALITLLCLSCMPLVAKVQPNPPKWPPASVETGGVFIFDPSDQKAQKVIDDIYRINGGQPDNGQFSPNRYALLFKPGRYPHLTVPVGYYTSVYGLGRSPKETQIFEVVCHQGSCCPATGALNTFWRSAENFTMKPTKSYWEGGPVCMLWAVSQACPLRRVNLAGANGNLSLYEVANGAAGYANGGFLADATISGSIFSGSQQQWLTRNTNMGNWEGAVWNMVFVGCSGAPKSHCGAPDPYTTVNKTPIIAEKPYIIYHEHTGKYSLVLPGIEYGKKGASTREIPGTKVIGFECVYVASPDKDTANSISLMIDRGFHIVLTPGIYELNGSIVVNRSGICILGLGFPTLVAAQGAPCIEVMCADQVRIAGILLQAGRKGTEALLKWGAKGEKCSFGLLCDCFARVGGATSSRIDPVTADAMVEINSSNIVCDNLWLWRADHDVGGVVINGDNPCQTGFIANGKGITAYGLAVEHTLQDQVRWNGNEGKCYFFQSEFPCDVTEQNYGEPGYAAYRVAEHVKNHKAFGLAAYCFFRDHPVRVKSAIKTPASEEIHFTHSLTRWLSGKGGIEHVINDTGEKVNHASPGPVYICDFK